MPLPLAPVAAIALRYGTVALATYTVARRIEAGRRDQQAEDALDDIPEGLTARREAEQINATARSKRIIRFGNSGKGVEIDATALGRIKVRKL